MTNLSCGIDFGTSNSAIAISNLNPYPQLVPVEKSKPTIPSTIFFAEGKANAYYGNEAISRYISGETGRFMRSLKRVLGTDLMRSGTVISGHLTTFEDILCGYLSHLKSKAEDFAADALENVVMGRPVHFRDNDPKGDIQAEQELARIAGKIGFKNILFQYEPIAAAFAHENNLTQEMLACVIDIGGGTSDFTVIRLGPERRKMADRSSDILGNSGIRIGGNDFDKDLSMATFMPAFGYQTTYGPQNLFVPSSQFFELSEWSKINSVYTYQNRKTVAEVLVKSHQPELYRRLAEILERESGHKILNEVEAAKIALADNQKICRQIDFLSDKPQIVLSNDDFEQSIKGDVTKIVKALGDCLSLAGVCPADIKLVIMTGGSTEIPYIQQTIYQYFTTAAFSNENKLSSVGLGLACDSRRHFG